MHKKIIFVHLLNDYSGSPKVLSQIISTIKYQKYDVELYIGTSKRGFLSEVLENEVSYFYKRFNNKYLTLISFILSQIILFFKLLKYRDDDILIYINTLLPFGAALAGKFMNKKVYYHIHEISIKPLIFKKFLRFIVQRTASKVVFVSKFLQQSESFKNIEQKVIYNVLPADYIKFAKNNIYKFHYKNFNVLMICSLKKYKGINEFIEIAYLCKTYSYIKFTLVLNAEDIEIETYFKDKEIPLNVVLVSKQQDVTKFYQNTNLLLNLSRIDEWIETFGLTILEAMAFGVPVIVPPIGGPTEIVRDKIDGYHISSYEVEKISKCIQELSCDEKRCLCLSNNAKNRIKKFDASYFESNINKVIHE